MVPRRSHKKSRNGCVQCKKRRVKCDEKGPICRNCTKRQLPCSFKDSPPDCTASPTDHSSRSITTPPELPGSHESPKSNLPKDEPVRRNDRLLELGLMNHWSTCTALSLCNHGSAQPRPEFDESYFWQTIIPEQAFKHEFLMNAILTLTVLHIMDVDEPNVLPVDLSLALEYHTAACSGMRDAIQNVDEHSCHAVFACSLLTIVNVLALPPPMDSEQTTPLKLFFICHDIVNGTKNVQQSLLDHLQKGPTGTMLNVWLKRYDTVVCRPDTAEAIELLRSINRQQNASQQDGKFAVYDFIIDRIEHWFAWVDNERDSGASIAWLGDIEPAYLVCVQKHEPLALAILACWGVMVDQPSNLWWAKHSGKALIDEIYSFNVLDSDTYSPFIEWTRKRVGK